MTEIDRVGRARARADAAKLRLSDTFTALRRRLDPQKVARDAVDGIVDQGAQALQSGVETAKNNPGPVIGGAALIAAFLSRRSLTRLIWRRRPQAAKPAFGPDVQDGERPPKHRRKPR